MLNPTRKQIIKADRGHHHENKSRLAPGIEEEARNQKPVIAKLLWQQEIDSVSNRKKKKKKLNTGEEHRPGFSSFGIQIGIPPVQVLSVICPQAIISGSEKE